MKPYVVVIDDLEPARDMLRRALSRSFRVEDFPSVTEALASLETREPDVVVTDVRMPEIDGIQGLRLFRERLPGCPVIVVTAYATVEDAVEAIKAGAFEYLRKPFDPDQLELLVARAAEHRLLERDNARLRREVQSARSIDGIVGGSEAMRGVVSLLERVAPTDVPILIEGESGTGKDLLARAAHGMSRRAAGPFLALNMSAIPEALAESELFGHVKGAFSGADSAHAGFFAEARGGTLFLDEIGMLAPALQPKLLRVLQNGEFIPVGGRRPSVAEVRVMCATNEDLKKRVEEGRFREDLYYRIHVVSVRLPPLRERRDDIPPLVEHFVRKHAARLGRPPLASTPEVLATLAAYSWPGNVRELENAVERALLLARGETLSCDDLPPEVAACEPAAGATGYRRARDAWERRYLDDLMHEAGGSVARAAELAGLHRSTLYEKLTRLGLLREGTG